MTDLSELLVYIAYGCAFIGLLIVIVMWRQDVKETKKGIEQ